MSLNLTGNNLYPIANYTLPEQNNNYYTQTTTALYNDIFQNNLGKPLNCSADIESESPVPFEYRMIIQYWERDSTTNKYFDINGRNLPEDITVKALIIRAFSNSTQANGYGANISNIMLNKGTTALPYEPYKSINPENIKVNMSSNLIPYPYKTSTTNINGVDFTVNEDGSVLVNGTNTSTTSFCWFQLTGDISFKEGEPCFLSGCPSGGSLSTYRLRTAAIDDTGNGALINKTVSKTQIFIVIGIGATVENLIFKPMLNKGTTALPYEKYIAPKDVEKVVVAKSPNLQPYPFSPTTSVSGITATYNDDGSVSVNGTATADAYFWNIGHKPYLKAGVTYTLSGCPEGGSRSTYAIAGLGWKPLEVGNGTTFSVEEDGEKQLGIFIKSGTTVENLTFYPMLNKGTKALPYQKYDREVVWSKTTSDEVIDDTTVISDEGTEEETTLNEVVE